MIKDILKILLIAVLLGGQLPSVYAVTTTPNILPYEGVLKTPGGVPVTTAQNFRFSIWSDSDWSAPADFDGAGDIPPAAPGFSGYEEVQTVVPDVNGFFQIFIGAVNPIPDFVLADHQYLQVEIKANGSPNTSYEILDVDGIDNTNDRQRFGTVPYARNADFIDNAEIGTSAGNIAILGAGDVFPFSLIPGGTDAEVFELDKDGTGGVIELSFGDTILNRILSYDPNGVAPADGWFDFSDDVNVTGNVTVTGTFSTASGITLTGGSADFSSVSQLRLRESNFTPAPDCANVGELVFDTTASQIKYCTAVGSPGTWAFVDAPAQDLDSVYATDGDKTLSVNDPSGLSFNSSSTGDILFNLQNTGDLVIQDNGTTFALFTDTGLFEVRGLENTERIRLTDTTNNDSVGLYVGNGSPDGVITGESGSAYFDEGGSLYVNNSVGGSGDTWNKVDLTKAQTVTVAKSGADFTSLKDAVDSIVDASAAKRYIVEVYPGTYIEDPITLPDYVSIIGQGAPQSVIIQANDPTGVLILGGAQSLVRNLQMEGASGVGGVCFRTSKASFVQDVELNSCETGLLATSATGVLIMNNLFVRSGAFTDVARIEAGATGNINAMRVTTSSPISKVYHVTGAGTRAQLNNTVIRLSTVTDAVYVNDSALVTILNTNLQDMVNGIHVGPLGSSIVRGSGGIVENTSGNTFLVESGGAKVYYDGFQTQKEKFNVHPGALFSVVFNNNTQGEEGTNVFGRFSVGTPEYPDDVWLGSGDPFTNGMMVYTFDGLDYTDVSLDASNPVGTPFSLPGTAVDNAIYLSVNRTLPSGDFIKFGGFKYITSSTALDPGTGSLVHEYWNGSAWVVFSTFCYQDDFHYRYNSRCYLRPDNVEQNNFSLDIINNWVENDPPGLGDDRFWVRIRVASPITTAPIFQQFKVQPNSLKVTDEGTILLHGTSRSAKQIIHGVEEIFHTTSMNSPANASYRVGLGTSVAVDKTGALFRGDGISLDELNGSFALPKGIDTSSPLTVKLYWRKTTNTPGMVKWKIDDVHNNPRNVLIANGANVETAPRPLGNDHVHGINTLETVPTDSTDAGEVILSTFTEGINIQTHYEGDLVYIRLYRDAADPDDTYVDPVILTGFQVEGLFWNLSPKQD